MPKNVQKLTKIYSTDCVTSGSHQHFPKSWFGINLIKINLLRVSGYTHKSLKSGLEVRNGGGGQKSIFLDLLRET